MTSEKLKFHGSVLLSAKKPYRKSYAKEIKEWLVSGKAAQSWYKSKGLGRDVYYRFLRDYPDFKQAVEFGTNSKGYEFQESYIESCNAAILSEMSFEDWKKSLDKKIPSNVIFFWEDMFEDFHPSRLIKAVGNKGKYRKVYELLLIEHMSKGRSPASFCSDIGITRKTFHEWVNRHASMREAYFIAKEKCQEFYENLAEGHVTGSRFEEGKPKHMQKADPNFLRFVMERRLKDYQPNMVIEDAGISEEAPALKTQIDYSKLPTELLAPLAKILEHVEKQAKENGAPPEEEEF